MALTTTDLAFVACPPTGIAPFSNDAPSAGWSTVSVGASMTRNGTVMNRWMVSSDVLPVSGSRALTSNWLRPRRRSTSAAHAPVEPAVTSSGSRPGVAIETVAPGSDVPSSVYVVVVSSTSMTATEGCVTDTVGGLVKRSTWIAR